MQSTHFLKHESQGVLGFVGAVFGTLMKFGAAVIGALLLIWVALLGVAVTAAALLWMRLTGRRVVFNGPNGSTFAWADVRRAAAQRGARAGSPGGSTHDAGQPRATPHASAEDVEDVRVLREFDRVDHSKD